MRRDISEEEKRLLRNLPEEEAKSTFVQLLSMIRPLEFEPELHLDLAEQAIQFRRSYMEGLKRDEELRKKAEMEKLAVHVVFDDSIGGLLKRQISHLDRRDSDRVIALSDCYGSGPLNGILSYPGMYQRMQWQEQHEKTVFNEKYTEHFMQQRKTQWRKAIEQLVELPKRHEVYIWASENVSEQVGLRMALKVLEHLPHSITIVQAEKWQPKRSNTTFHSVEATKEDIQQIIVNKYKLQRLNPEEKSRYIKEWDKLEKADGVLRTWSEGKINSYPIDYFDQDLIEVAYKLQEQGENSFFIYQILNEYCSEQSSLIHAPFFSNRLKHLTEEGVFTLVEKDVDFLNRWKISLLNH